MSLTPTQIANTKRLIAALRSGKYQRTEQYLHDKNGFCPWGVACDLIDPTRWSELKEAFRFDTDPGPSTKDIFYYHQADPDCPADEAEFFAPPDDVAVAYGDLARANFTYADLTKVLPERFLPLCKEDRTGYWSLIELNDNFHLSLRETADVLEELFLTGNYLGGQPEEQEPYDYVADDLAFDAAREQRLK